MKNLLLFFLLISSMPLLAHGDLDARIKKVSKQIEKDPHNIELYKKRGTLYYQHEEYRKSIVDFEHALFLGDQSNELSILRAQSYLKAKKAKISIEILSPLVEANEQDVVASRLLGNAYLEQKNYQQAIFYLQNALNHSQKKLPEHFIQLANVLNQEGGLSSYEKATSTIQDGMNTLGELPVLLNRLVELHKSRQQIDAAIETQTKIIDISLRKEIPYFERALLYLSINDNEKARKDIDLAKLSISKLPRRLALSDTMIKLSNEITKTEERLTD